jgi:hypothetical protein
MDPIPPVIMTMVHELGYLCSGNVCMAGSAVLIKYLRDKMEYEGRQNLPGPMVRVCGTATNEDVDIFVGTYDRRNALLEAPWCQEAPCASECHEKFCRFSRLMRRTHGTSINIINMVPGIPGDQLGQGYAAWNMSIVRGICCVITTDVTPPKGQPTRVQFIYLSLMPHPNMSWGECVVQSFDIDICKGVMHLPQDSVTWSLVMPADAEESISQGRFNYIVQPFLMFEQHVYRIEKYMKKGFSLNSMRFHNLCSPAYKQLIMSKFHAHFAVWYACEILDSAGMDVFTSKHLARHIIAPMFHSSKVGYILACHAAAVENARHMMSATARVADVFPNLKLRVMLWHINMELKRRMSGFLAAWISGIVIRRRPKVPPA